MHKSQQLYVVQNRSMIQTISKIICRRDPKVNKNLCGIKGRMLWKLSIFSCFFFFWWWKSIYIFPFWCSPLFLHKFSISGRCEEKECLWGASRSHFNFRSTHATLWLESNYILRWFWKVPYFAMIQFSCAWKLKNLILRKILHMPSSSRRCACSHI